MAGSSKTVIYAALIGNGAIAVTKFIAASITGSSAMLSEGIHSLVDTGNQVLLLYGLKRSARPADERFPYGYGKEVYFWSFVVAIMIFAVGAGVSLYEGVHRVMHPEPLKHVVINYIVLSLAIVFEGGAWYMAFREFRRSKGDWGYFEAVSRGKDPTLFVVLFEDSAAMLGLVVALVAIMISDFTGLLIFDGLASIVIGLILAGTAAWLAFETKGLLIGESANPRVVNGVRKMVMQDDSIIEINDILTMHMGPSYILLNLSVVFAESCTADDIAARVARLDEEIRAAFPRVRRIFIEAEPSRKRELLDSAGQQ